MTNDEIRNNREKHNYMSMQAAKYIKNQSQQQLHQKSKSKPKINN